MNKRNRISRPTDSEIDILNILWDNGPSTVRYVHELLSQTKPSQYTTTLKLMQIMAEKGLVDRDVTERSHTYRPLVQREQVQRQMTAQLIDRVFGGSTRSLLMGALGAKRVSKEELADLRRLIDDHEKGGKGKPR